MDISVADPLPEDAQPETEHYVAHLAEVNKSNEVVSTEDIRNAHGVLVVRKGARIDAEAAQRVTQHKLLKPLEEQVQIKDVVDGSRLLRCFKDLSGKYPDLGQIHGALRFGGDFSWLTTERKLHQVLIQKTTVLHQQLDDVFEKAVFCAWLAALVAREMKLNSEDIHTAYVAGLIHDMGFLHIDPAIIRKTGELDAAEWRAIQSHVVIGKMILENTAGIEPRISRAVLEHHERCDGTGYPAGKDETRLDILGQIVALADSLQAIRVNQFAKSGRNLRDALPYLQMNSATHFYAVYQAMASILKKSGLAPTVSAGQGSFTSLAAALHARSRALRAIVADVDALLVMLQPRTTRPRGRALLKVADNVQRMIVSSGLTREEFISWLAALQDIPDEAALAELNEVELMQNELVWQVRKIRNSFGEFYDRECDPHGEACQELLAIAERMNGHLAVWR